MELSIEVKKILFRIARGLTNELGNCSSYID